MSAEYVVVMEDLVALLQVIIIVVKPVLHFVLGMKYLVQNMMNVMYVMVMDLIIMKIVLDSVSMELLKDVMEFVVVA